MILYCKSVVQCACRNTQAIEASDLQCNNNNVLCMLSEYQNIYIELYNLKETK